MEDSVKDGEFDEEEVWCYEIRKEDPSPMSRKPMDRSSAWRIPSAPRMMIRRGSNSSSSSPAAGGGSHESTDEMSSAPLNIPDWSKIYGKHANKEAPMDNGDYGEEEEEEGMVPPHEWLGRKFERNNRISSFSVCEGMGRTLKGRDLSKLRNAVLTKTGFLE